MADAGVAKLETGEYTGRYLVLLDQDDMDSGIAALRSGAGVTQPERLHGRDLALAAEVTKQGGSMVLDHLGVAVVTAAPDQRPALKTTVMNTSSLLTVEPERVLYAMTVTEYLQGYRDGVSDAVDRSVHHNGASAPSAMKPGAFLESTMTWGTEAIGIPETAFTGEGIGVAVLDTGVDRAHPDLAGRIVEAISFVPHEAVDDEHGHGTHCIGTACGPAEPQGAPRYGVACKSGIFAFKVLGRDGSGAEGDILAAVNAAVVDPRIKVISMSLGAEVRPGTSHSKVFQRAAHQGERNNKLIIAAAGNESDRPGMVRPVGHPANCPSVIAVGAIARDFTVAPFSNGGLTPGGGELDLVGPGVDVLSARAGGGHVRFSGTSMATPHVAGVVALLWQRRPEATATEIRNELLRLCRDLDLAARDGGAGLVRVPVG